MNKSVAMLSGAALALLLSAGPSLAGGAVVSVDVTAPRSTIYSNESVIVSATLTSDGNNTDCSSGQQVDFKAQGQLLCRKSLTSTPAAAGAWNYTVEPCTVNGSDLNIGSNTIVAELTSGYCFNDTNHAGRQLSMTVLPGNAPAAVPTTGEWTLWGLTGLLLIGGGVFASRRFRATAA